MVNAKTFDSQIVGRKKEYFSASQHTSSKKTREHIHFYRNRPSWWWWWWLNDDDVWFFYLGGSRQRKALLKTKRPPKQRRVESKIEVSPCLLSLRCEVKWQTKSNKNKQTNYLWSYEHHGKTKVESSIATIVVNSIAAATVPVGGFVGSYQTHKLWSYKDRIETTSIKISNIAFNVACNPFSAVAVWVAAVQFISKIDTNTNSKHLRWRRRQMTQTHSEICIQWRTKKTETD